jgi:hypothetical protein
MLKGQQIICKGDLYECICGICTGQVGLQIMQGCKASYYANLLDNVKGTLRHLGWTTNSKHGWVCPKCFCQEEPKRVKPGVIVGIGE